MRHAMIHEGMTTKITLCTPKKSQRSFCENKRGHEKGGSMQKVSESIVGT
jgi:hypothetical protein